MSTLVKYLFLSPYNYYISLQNMHKHINSLIVCRDTFSKNAKIGILKRNTESLSTISANCFWNLKKYIWRFIKHLSFVDFIRFLKKNRKRASGSRQAPPVVMRGRLLSIWSGCSEGVQGQIRWPCSFFSVTCYVSLAFLSYISSEMNENAW